MRMAATLQAMTLCLANTHSVFATAHGNVCLASPEIWHSLVQLKPVPEQLRMRMSPVTKKSAK